MGVWLCGNLIASHIRAFTYLFLHSADFVCRKSDSTQSFRLKFERLPPSLDLLRLVMKALLLQEGALYENEGCNVRWVSKE